MKISSTVIALGFLISTTIAVPAWSTSLKITGEDGSQLALFDRDDIEALGVVEINTATPWTDGIVRFQGVSVKTVLATAGIDDANVTGLALDDYAVTLEADIIEKYDPIIATRMNGVLMTVEDKGPFWIMFDFDDLAEEESAELRSFAVWHLVEFEVE